MSYPPQWRVAENPAETARLIAEYPFAHLVTAENGELRSTRIPFVADWEDDRPVRLRAHLNAQNPQAATIDEARVLVVFAGPASYVSPNWRTDRSRAGTFDYQEVRVRGTARAVEDRDFFTGLIDDLAQLIEPQYAEVGDYPVWQTSMAPEGYVEKLFPHVTPFTVEIGEVETISKLHQSFPREDRAWIADHLERSHRSDARTIAERIRDLDR